MDPRLRGDDGHLIPRNVSYPSSVSLTSKTVSTSAMALANAALVIETPALSPITRAGPLPPSALAKARAVLEASEAGSEFFGVGHGWVLRKLKAVNHGSTEARKKTFLGMERGFVGRRTSPNRFSSVLPCFRGSLL
jgi:hypothetical protein